MVSGFGFDVKTKDCKVVQIASFFVGKVGFVLRVQVYSLSSSNSWRVLEGDGGINSLFPKQPVVEELVMDGEVYLNGSYFFKGIYMNEDEIRHWVLSFDFTKEIFTTVQFPVNHVPNSPLILACYYFGEKKIASLRRRGGDDDDQSNFLVYDIWVLNIIEHDQKEEESYYWTKSQHSIQISKRREISKWVSSWWICSRFISNDGEFALIETRGGKLGDCELQLFNSVTKEEKTVFPTGLGLERADVYKPTLVSIIGGGNGNGNGTAAAAADWSDFGGDWW